MTAKQNDTPAKTTKTALVRSLLESADGTTLTAICAATGWQLHSARAALSTMRKSGLAIERMPRNDTDPESRYRIVASGGAAR